MQLLVKHQLIPITMQPKSISLEQICYKRSQGTAVASLHCLLSLTSKNKDLRTNLEKGNLVLLFEFLWTSKFIFFFFFIKINNLITLRSTNQITEISAPRLSHL